jgi:tetratricopeptide (TPR) repeat protein
MYRMGDVIAEIQQLLDMQKIKQADVRISKALRQPNAPDMQAPLMLLRARVKLMLGRPEGALDDLDRARELVTSATDSLPVRELLADCYFARYELAAIGFAARADLQLAEQLYNGIAAERPDYYNLGWIRYQMGRIALTQSNIDQAEQSFQQALVLPAVNAALTAYCYERMGFVAFYERRDIHSALSLLNKAVQTYPSHAPRIWLIQAHLLRARVMRDGLRLQDALAAAETALKLAVQGGADVRAGHLEALLTIGEILSRSNGSEDGVIAALEQYFQLSRKPVGIDVTWSRAYEMLGDAYLATHQIERAVTALLAALQYNPYHPWEVSIYMRVAKAYYAQGDYPRVINALNHAMGSAQAEDQSIGADIYDLLGSAQYALGSFRDAIVSFDAALALLSSRDAAAQKIEQYRAYAIRALNHDPVTP